MANRAVKASRRAGSNARLKNAAAKARNRATRALDAAMKAVSAQLAGYVGGFPDPRRLHPFDAALLELTVGARRYDAAVRRVEGVRRAAVHCAKTFAARAARAPSVAEAERLGQEGLEELRRVICETSREGEGGREQRRRKGAGKAGDAPEADAQLAPEPVSSAASDPLLHPSLSASAASDSSPALLSSSAPLPPRPRSPPVPDAFDELIAVARALRRLPLVDPELPTVALVGAPNVGKSSLVRRLSTGAPEVRDYPFTTRSVALGHFFVRGERHQVTDTPGLLPRPDDARNAMEHLTLATLEHLPTLAVFVADLTEGCGMSVADQRRLRDELRARHHRDDWIDVFTKADLLKHVFSEADGGERAGGNERDHSPSTAAAVPLPRDRHDWSEAIAMAKEVPGALRVSSTTLEGVEDLKERIVSAFVHRNALEEEQKEGGEWQGGREEDELER